MDWSRRDPVHYRVWARNPASFQERARDWHWTTYETLRKAGIPWVPSSGRDGRHLEKGYVVLGRRLLSEADVALVEANDLWIGRGGGRKRGVKEHQLVAARKYGRLPTGWVVRHRNGRKDDNRPSNLLLGTVLDNRIDHQRALAEMLYWRERALRAEGSDLVEMLVALST